MIKAVFFDWDFTLVDPKLVLKKIFIEFCKKQKANPDDYDFDKLVELDVKDIFKQFKVKKYKKPYYFYKYLKLAKQYRQLYNFKGHEVLNFLEKQNIPYVIITDNFRQVLRRNFDINPKLIVDYFNTRGKKIRGIKCALKKMNLKPHEVIYVGDKPSDIIAANQSNVFSVGILTSHTRKELEQHNPNLIIKNINELKNLFRK